MKKLDAIDKKILRALQKNSKITHAELANVVGLSASACSRRLTSLRKTKLYIITSLVQLTWCYVSLKA